MPFPNEHAGRLTDPKKYDSISRKNGQGGPGVDFVFGTLPGGKTEIQAVRFDSKRFTPEQAKVWLKDHNMETILFEDAMDETPIKKSESLTVDLYVMDVVKSNERYMAEAAYILDGTKGLERNNLVVLSEAIDTDIELRKGQVISITCSGVEPTRVHNKYGVCLINPSFSKVNHDRKTPDTTKNILQKADYSDALLASDSSRFDLSVAGLIKDSGFRSVSFEQVEGSLETIAKHEFPLYKDANKRLVYGVVYEPDTPDSQGDYTTAAEIEKAAHTFLEEYNAHNLMHRGGLDSSKIKTSESYIAPQDFMVGGQLIRKGSWVLVSHVLDNDIWDLIEKGVINAYSMEGTGQTSDLAKRDSSDVQVQKRFLINMIIKAVALVDRGANRKKFFLMKREDIAMNKEKFIALVKSALLNAVQIEAIGKEIGLKAEEIAEISKGAVAPKTLEEIIKASHAELKAEIITALQTALTAVQAMKDEEEVTKELDADGNSIKEKDEEEKMPAEMMNAEVAKRAEWCAAHPNAEVPDDCMSAVMDIISKRETEKISQTE